MKKHAHGQKKKKKKKTDFDRHFFLLFPFLFSSFPPSLFPPFSAHLLHPAIWDRLKRYRFDSTSKIEVENDFFEKIFLTFFPTLQASNWLLINADFFIFPALIVCICTYSMVSKHETYLLPGWNEGRSKSTFRQLRISTLWTSKGYGKKLNND